MKQQTSWLQRSAVVAVLALLGTVLAVPAGGQVAPETDFMVTEVDQGLGRTRGLAVGDVTGDGNPDILVAAVLDGPVLLYRGDGAGSFGTGEVLDPDLAGAYGITLGDINGDGTTDILVTDFRADRLQWYSSDGEGGFSGPMVVDAEIGGAARAAIGDMDGDGNVDIVVTAYYSGHIRWYRGDGQGGFSDPRLIDRALCSAWDTRLGDMDGDGDLDVVATGDDEVLLYRNNGGRFNLEIVDANDPIARGFNLADINDDGSLDIIVASFDGTVIVYPNDGTGRFTPSVVVGEELIRPWEVTVTDVTGDGITDIVASTLVEVLLFPGLGDGQFGEHIVLDGEINWWRGIDSGDVNGDGYTDVIVTGARGSSPVRVYHGGPSILSPPPLTEPEPESDQVLFLTEVQDESPWDSTILEASLTNVFAVTLADINGDGAQDVAAVGFEGLVRVYPSDGLGGFTYPLTLDTTLEGGQTIAFGDFNGDRLIDVVAGGTQQVRQYMNNGRGSFSRAVTVRDQGAPGLQTGDLDGDGDDEILTTDDAGNLEYYSHTGQGFQATLVEAGRCLATEIAVADTNGDNSADILLGWAGQVRIYTNDGTGAFLTGTARPTIADTFLGGPSSLKTGRLNNDDRIDLIAAGFFSDNVVVLRNTGNQGNQPVYAMGTPTRVLGTGGLYDGVLGDLTGDGLDDVITFGAPFGTVILHPNQGGSGFGTPVLVGFLDLGSFDGAVGDVTGDGRNDLVAILGDEIHIFAGDGTGGHLPPPSAAFWDVSPSSVHAASIEQLRRLEIATPGERGGFAPGVPATRAELATWLARIWETAGNNCPIARSPFRDFDRTAPYTAAVDCMYGLGIITGISPATFAPEQTVSRAQVASLLTRLWERIGNQCPADSAAPFTDVVAGSTHADAINCLASLGISSGVTQDRFAPNQDITRAQLATLLVRLWQNL